MEGPRIRSNETTNHIARRRWRIFRDRNVPMAEAVVNRGTKKARCLGANEQILFRTTALTIVPG